MKAISKQLLLCLTLCILLSALLIFCVCDAYVSDALELTERNGVEAYDSIQLENVTIDVTEFGADPTGIKDSAEAIQAAIAQAKKYTAEGKHATVSFPEGRYDIYPDNAVEKKLFISNTTGADLSTCDKKIGILLENINNITIDGNNSLFMFHGKMTTFACIDCKNVIFKNFEVDFQVPTVIDITVEKLIGLNAAIVSIPACYNYSISGNRINFFSDNSPYTNQPYWTLGAESIKYTQRYNKNSGLAYRGNIRYNALFSNVLKIQDLGNNRIQITYSSRSEEIAPDICFQMRPTVRDHAGAYLWKSKDVRLEHIDIRFLHGFGVVGQHSENITLDSINFETNSDRGNSSAGYADFIQMSGCKGKIDIGNCTFSNPHDDPINIHGTYMQVVGANKNKVVVRYKHSETAGFPNFFVGDRIEFVDSRSLSAVKNSQRTVIAVDGPDGMGGQTGNGSDALQTITLTLDEAPPASVKPLSSIHVENITCTPGVHIHDSVFKQIATRGILATTRGKIVIENNSFDGIGMAGIYISDDANTWYESGHVEDLTIKGNVFMRSQAQAILIDPTNSTISRTSPVHYNINIENNTFFVDNSYVLEAKSVKGLRFANNNICLQTQTATGSEYLQENLTANPIQDVITDNRNESSANYFRLRACTDVLIQNNSYQSISNAIAEYSDMYESDVTVSNDKVTLIKVASEISAFTPIWAIPILVLTGGLIVAIPILIDNRRRRASKNIKYKTKNANKQVAHF